MCETMKTLVGTSPNEVHPNEPVGLYLGFIENRIIYMTLLVLFGLVTAGLADLDEDGFEDYREGFLQGQKNWFVDRMENGKFVDAREYVCVVRDAQKNGQCVEWKEGFGGAGRVRAVKHFPDTIKSKVLIILDYLPGNDDLGALNFQQIDDAATQGGPGNSHLVSQGPTLG